MKVSNAGPGPRGIRPAGGGMILLERGQSFVGDFEEGELEAMGRPGRYLQVTEATKDEEKAAQSALSGGRRLTPTIAEEGLEGTGDDNLQAVHRGGGSYSVMRGDQPVESIEHLDRDTAERFNRMSPERKAKFVEKNSKAAE